MKRLLGVLCIVCFGLSAGCMGARPAPPYTSADQAFLVGKADCIDSGWFNDRRTSIKLDLFRLTPDGGKVFINTITSDYTVLAVQPGIYGLSKTFFQVKSGLTYVDKGYVRKGRPVHAPLFESHFWQLTELEQTAELPKFATEFFGILKVEAGDVLYYGDLTLDIATNRKLPMVVESRNRQAAEQALGASEPSKRSVMKDAHFIGPAFFLGKIRESRS